MPLPGETHTAGKYSAEDSQRGIAMGTTLLVIAAVMEVTFATYCVTTKRMCGLCHLRKHTRMVCHHMIPDASGGPNTFDNCNPSLPGLPRRGHDISSRSSSGRHPILPGGVATTQGGFPPRCMGRWRGVMVSDGIRIRCEPLCLQLLLVLHAYLVTATTPPVLDKGVERRERLASGDDCDHAILRQRLQFAPLCDGGG